MHQSIQYILKMDWDDLGEIDNTWVIAILLAGLMSCAIWFLPNMFGAKSYPLWIKIVVPICLVPISYFVIDRMNN